MKDSERGMFCRFISCELQPPKLKDQKNNQEGKKKKKKRHCVHLYSKLRDGLEFFCHEIILESVFQILLEVVSNSTSLFIITYSRSPRDSIDDPLLTAWKQRFEAKRLKVLNSFLSVSRTTCRDNLTNSWFNRAPPLRGPSPVDDHP